MRAEAGGPQRINTAKEHAEAKQNVEDPKDEE